MHKILIAFVVLLSLGCSNLPVPMCEVPATDAPCESGQAVCVPLHDDWYSATNSAGRPQAIVSTPVGSDVVFDEIPRCDADLFAVCPNHAGTGEETRAVCLGAN